MLGLRVTFIMPTSIVEAANSPVVSTLERSADAADLRFAVSSDCQRVLSLRTSLPMLTMDYT